MARLPEGKRDARREQLWRTLYRYRWGIRESELSQELGWNRRTLNNYLRELQREGRAYKEGRSWFAS